MEGLENELLCRWSDGKLILQPFHRFTYITAHSRTLPSLYLRHSSFSNPSIALPTSQPILQPFHCFTYITAHSPSFPSLHLCHSSLSNPSVTLSTSQLIVQPFCHFIYVTAHSLTLPFALAMSQLILQPFFRFSYVTWRAPHAKIHHHLLRDLVLHSRVWQVSFIPLIKIRMRN